MGIAVFKLLRPFNLPKEEPKAHPEDKEEVYRVSLIDP